MAKKPARVKKPAAVASGRRAAKKGDRRRILELTPGQPSNGARNSVPAHREKAKTANPDGTTDRALLTLLKRLKATDDPAGIREVSCQIERVIFHKQFRAKSR